MTSIQLDKPTAHGKWRLNIVDPDTGRVIGKLKSVWLEETQVIDAVVVMGCTFYVTKDGRYLLEGIMGKTLA